MFEFRLSYSQRYLASGLVGLALWLVSGIALTKYRCKYSTLKYKITDVLGIGVILNSSDEADKL